MTEFLQFAILGLGAGSAYALLAQGIVLVYRGSGVVNFAQGAIAMVGAYICLETLRHDQHWGLLPAFLVAVVVAGLIGLAFQLLVLRWLANAAPIVRLAATLGLMVILQAGVQQYYGSTSIRVKTFLPDEAYRWGGVVVQQDRMILLGIAILSTAALWAWTNFTRVGLAITASAENERAAAALGWSPQRLATLTWTVGGALAGAAGIMVAPLTGLTPSAFVVIVTVSALAAALLGGFRSFPLTLIGGLLLGVGESLVVLYQDDLRDLLGMETLTGVNRAVPFLVILVVLVVRGKGLPLRSHVSERLPKLGSGEIRWPLVVLGILVAVGIILGGGDWLRSLTLTLAAAVFLLSIVVLTGFAGQLSLAQYTVGGLGALFAARLVGEAGWPLVPAALVSVAAVIAIGVVFALPALRTRGVNLAVVTLGLGFTIQEMVFNNPTFTGDKLEGSVKIHQLSLFGLDVTPSVHPERWATVCLVALVVCGLIVANLRRSRTGRRLIAVRTNERAAASLGISVFGVKIYAFALASGLAAVAGILLGLRNTAVTYLEFNVFASINAVVQAVTGGLGFVTGSLIGSLMAPGAVFSRLLSGLAIAALLGGVILIVTLLTNQNGIADMISRGVRKNPALAAVLARKKRRGHELSDEAPTGSVTPTPLTVRGLTVRFGGVTAVDGVDLDIAPGQVVGLIGPNGAGKTTVIDAITGFVSPAAGKLTLGDQDITGWSTARRSKGGLRRSFQSLELFEDVTVGENIHAGADESTWLARLTDLVTPGRHPLSPSASAVVRDFELENDLDVLPSELSYGQRRLVGIARAVASAPSVILLDEPAAGLDDAESRELAVAIRHLAVQRGAGVLLIEHDMGLVMSTCDRIVVLAAGQVLAAGTPEEIAASPAVRDAYLGTEDDTTEAAR
ncbi:amino acid/amide ABC transporter membrane protein 1 (HAAT family) /amino acid/amide ABC transporter membrane protein 2 (HAAT family) /amino acid/amide ABC transporter ATP-binding protein 1 (HAAT family) [Rhodococcus sp. OK611]|uniref:ABC transporter permease subunit n=1 Tax=unclassified Rhodococcus (in: high G+C Gram-positive bacteria) TaxID=192944 RepID=UPI000BD242BA|nr:MULTISPECIES: ATP-binding cassette domain-containing protein [unclassified Rhodococcus (in: high G+C Gram-positive bacteria)]PTR44080.1 amino acid/amide ABC transporter membrane protein 1 (HAAT family) /amino acid/amide ABC transporter membrane protein 2 (HAAT family) /amino acid/amide ABC transporter ATP-binding protein 1 (HAAT family) [Rhodococcus sp. OK611]SNX90382.1 amino acid/amide ABC transporter membrane protein 1, HAAT family /amino acid/amide ABC transporter membrane protein 2, HAAT f